MITIMTRYLLRCLLITLVAFLGPSIAWATFTIQTQNAVDMTLTGFDGLNNSPSFRAGSAKETSSKSTLPIAAWHCLALPAAKATR